MSLQDYGEALVLNHLLRTATWAKPTNVYISLHSAAPSEDGSADHELSGGSYARVAVSCSNSNWSAPNAAGQTSNSNNIDFPTASADWTAATYVGIYDASTVGNLIASGALGATKTVLNGETARFAASSLTITAS